jgi:DNA-directed RNA polymerase specialized sigma24 family protein
VIFVHDVERCLKRLTPEEREMVKRIGLQEYTLTEAATMAGVSMRTAGRRYFGALDQLTHTFLRLGLMQVPGMR